jgi:hypothetical protein
MLMIAPGATIIAVIISAGIYALMKRRSLRAESGDIRLGLMTYATRLLLHRMEDYRVDERTWKPNLLVLSGSPAARWHLIELADAIAQSRSFVTVAAFLPEEQWSPDRLTHMAEVIRGYLLKRSVPAFVRTLPATDPFEGAETMIRSYGFGPLRPNTIMIGDTRQSANFARYARLVQLVHRSRRNLIIVRQPEGDTEQPRDSTRRETGIARRIDVWWSPGSPNTPLMLAVAVLLRRSRGWTETQLRVRTVVPSEREVSDVNARLMQFLANARIEADTEILVGGDRKAIEVIGEASTDADLVFMGLRSPRDDESAEDFAAYYEQRLRLTEALPTTAFVMAGEQLDFYRIFQAHG